MQINKRTQIAGILLLPLIVLSLAHCRKQTGTNVLLITIDTLRSDHCSTYGYAHKTSPIMDQVSAEGARFELAYCQLPQTTPSHASMFTGRYPIGHGLTKNGRILDPKEVTLAEILKERGYQTAAILSAFPVDSRFQLDQGFDVYQDEFKTGGKAIGGKKWAGQDLEGNFSTTATDTTARAISWLTGQRSPDKPFFLWLHYFDPHGPYDPPDPYRQRFARPSTADDLDQRIGLYDGEINYTDEEIGRVLDFLKQQDLNENTIVILTSDHGEGLMEHGRLDHGHLVYEEDMRVPLVFRWPGHIPEKRILSGPVELVDLMPTVLELLNIERPQKLGGHSLARPLLGLQEVDPNRPAFFQRRYGATRPDQFGVRCGRFKYIEVQQEGRESELYDLINDPDERVNLVESNKQESERLSAMIKEWQLKYQETHESLDTISEEDQEKLKALGYTQE